MDPKLFAILIFTLFLNFVNLGVIGILLATLLANRKR